MADPATGFASEHGCEPTRASNSLKTGAFLGAITQPGSKVRSILTNDNNHVINVHMKAHEFRSARLAKRLDATAGGGAVGCYPGIFELSGAR